MKLLQIVDENLAEEANAPTLTEAPDTSSLPEAGDAMVFYGIDPGTADHDMMTNAAKRLKKTNPHLYEKLVSLD